MYYLTIRQHDAFRTLLMGFEIPYRKYIASKVVSAFSNEAEFESAMLGKYNLLSPSSPKFLRNTLSKPKNRSNLKSLYKMLSDAEISDYGKVVVDVDVPAVGALNLVTFALTEQFQDLYALFKSYDVFCDLSDKYYYARNKLDHPGARTLEDSHLTPVLQFVRDICTLIPEELFAQKSKDQILAEVTALQQRKTIIPIAINNMGDIPYGDSRIVCRDQEIQKVKEFVYGKPDALRKPHSLCIYGYGGVGKTALAIEVQKQIIRDLLDGTTDYEPKYMLFFSAKRRKLSLAAETGSIVEQTIKWHFETAEELIDLIHSSIQRDSFRGFHEDGLIVIDNLEALSIEDRRKVKLFVDTQTPTEMQFLLTSRNSEDYDDNLKLAGFEAEAGIQFISQYIEENELEVDITEEQSRELTTLAKGNTLVLVLSLRRLSQFGSPVSSIFAEYKSKNVWTSLKKSLSRTPSNAYEVIAEFMYKDTFEQVEDSIRENKELFYKVIKVFAANQGESIDISTLCLLSDDSYPNVENIIDVLCNYLIVEKKETLYSLNGFAEKYVIGRFMPDSETYHKISTEILSRRREVKNSLEQLEHDLESNKAMASIMKDWQIVTEIDRITAAKFYHLYYTVTSAASRGSRALEDAMRVFSEECERAERVTAHPYVKYQKARILQQVDTYTSSTEKHDEQIEKAYIDCIFSIKAIEQYVGIQQTKNYATLLWFYGQHLKKNNRIEETMHYLEEGIRTFESLKNLDQEYLQCLSLLATTYIDYYEEEPARRNQYLVRAKVMYSKLQSHWDDLGKARRYVFQLRDRLKEYGQIRQ